MLKDDSGKWQMKSASSTTAGLFSSVPGLHSLSTLFLDETKRPCPQMLVQN